MYLKIAKKIDLQKRLSNFELPWWVNCSQIDKKEVIYINYEWNTISWVKIIYLGH